MLNKILIITDNVPNQVNGVVTTFQNLEKMAELDGYNVVYLDPRQFGHFNAPGYPEIKISIAWNIGKKIEKISPDYIHIATEGPIGVFAKLWLDFKSYRYSTSYHTKFPEILKKMYHLPECITWAYLKWFHKKSEAILVPTKSTVKELRQHKFQGKIKIWTRGVDRSTLRPTKEWTHKNKKPIVLYVGRLSKEKNVEEVCKLSDEYTVIIVGDGPERKNLQEKYSKVFFSGYRSGSELADYFAKADVFAFPSKSDTFGLVLIEAMNFGTPVAAYDVPGPADIIDNDTGVLGENLRDNVKKCLLLDRNVIEQKSKKWTWENCWEIFKNNLIEAKNGKKKINTN
jgi:glycosyltransferase involved in cell wall biosynthesis